MGKFTVIWGMLDLFFFSFIPFFILIVFVLVIVLIIHQSVRGVKRWKRDANSPVLTVVAKIVTKRSDVSHHSGQHHAAGHHNLGSSSSSTTYYVTFEVKSGDRLEFEVDGREYGYLAEGDSGQLTFQGSRYQGFERQLPDG